MHNMHEIEYQDIMKIFIQHKIGNLKTKHEKHKTLNNRPTHDCHMLNALQFFFE